MKNKIYINSLLDFYGNLLTENQILISNLYFKEDYSLSEIAQAENISRAAVHEVVKRSEEILINYENKLKLLESFNKRLKIYKQIKDFNKPEISKLIDMCIETEIKED